MLQVGQEVGLDFQLTLGTVQETVTVVGDAGLVETTRSGVASVIKKEQIDDLPVVERDFSSLALLAPGVSTGTGGYGAGGTGESLSFNGQRAFTNGVFIDGASAMWQFYGKQASTFPAGLGPGVPGADQLVRRGVRHRVGRHHERDLPQRVQHAERTRVRLFS